MKGTYGLSSKLPSFFDKKYFSCSQGCLTRNAMDIYEEESLIIGTVQETLQKTLTPLLERAMNASSLSDKIISVLENSHIEDDVTKPKFKYVPNRKKMKRRKKRKPQTKCDIIREGEVHAPKSFALFENDYLLNNVPKWNPYVAGRDFAHSYDNNSFSHITSEKESAYSENKGATVVRKRKKLQRRKKRKQKTNTNGNVCVHNVPDNESSVSGKDNLGSRHEDDDIFNEISSENRRNGNCFHDSDTTLRSPVLPTYTIMTSSVCKRKGLLQADSVRTNAEQTLDSSKNKSSRDIVPDTTIECDTNVIDANRKDDVCKDADGSGSHTSMSGEDLPLNKVAGGGQFSREKKRQLRRRMRNVKERPESFVVLGLI